MNNEGTTKEERVAPAENEKEQRELQSAAAESHLILFRIGATIHNHQPAALEAGLDPLYSKPRAAASTPGTN